MIETANNLLAASKLAFIGCGVMAESIIAGLLRQKLVTTEQIAASHPRTARRNELREKYLIEMFEDNAEAVRAGYSAANSTVVLCVKPQRMNGVLHELKGVVKPSQVVASIVAGVRIEKIAEELENRLVVRTMPNTPSQIGAGMTVWTCTAEVSETQKAQVKAMLTALGKEIFVETENMIDMANFAFRNRSDLYVSRDGSDDRCGSSPRIFARNRQRIGAANNARLGPVCDGIPQTSRRTPQYGHITRRNFRRSDLPNGKRRIADRSFKSNLRGVSKSGRIRREEMISTLR